MKILHINDNDLIGRRFNGHDLQIMLNKGNGYSAKQFVVLKSGDNENTIPIVKTEGSAFVKEKCREFEERIAMQSVIYPFGEMLFDSEEFKEADIVHYHLIFNNFLSLYSFQKLAKSKPTVWTLHDPWALTGHCVYPVDCKGWLTGCRNCPHLDRYFPLKEDNSASIWNIKKDIYKDLDIDLVVASEWMYEMVKQSPLTAHFKKVHLIPFGIDTNLFKRKEKRDEIRKGLGIDSDNFVIMFREANEWKGIEYIKNMLAKLESERPITILTVGEIGQLENLKGKYKIIECGWVNDNDRMVDLYSSADLFLMPSVAEAFG
jgi:glycosyltransferase involved in cell wall biosynthesis